ncbi:hypothetical protein ACFOND_14550 [Reinekea marina]|uniref:Uncharacterized protein n=1 Tax=Reinekea marina TaxID=1310421 RepID=A0ABV7WVF7_9GAMM
MPAAERLLAGMNSFGLLNHYDATAIDRRHINQSQNHIPNTGNE